MKLEQKLNILTESKMNKKMATCYFTYDVSYVHYYVADVNKKFVYAKEEFDFSIKGNEIRKISRLKKVNLRNDRTGEINEKKGLTKLLEFPLIDISSWNSIFNYLYNLDELVEVECDNDGTSYFGKILTVYKNKILFCDFDANGTWQEPFIIHFKDIDGVVWDSWYLNGWKDYFLSELK